MSMLHVDIRALKDHKQGKRDAHGWDPESSEWNKGVSVSMLNVDIRALKEHKQGKRDAHGWDPES